MGNMTLWLMDLGMVLWVGGWWQVRMTPMTPVKDATSIIDMSNVIAVNVKPKLLNRLDMLMAVGREIQRTSGKKGGERFAGSKREREIAQYLTLFMCICNNRPLRKMEDHARNP